jgi:hypothetical protein
MAQFYFRSHSNLLRRWGNIQSALTTTHGCCATPLSTIIPDRSFGRLQGSGIITDVLLALVVASSGTTEITMRNAPKNQRKEIFAPKDF